jgi:mannose-1-phosphate guanylyltransferase
MKIPYHQPNRCAVILAGGENRKLRGFIRSQLGMDIPKQFATFTGTRSMLRHTFARVDRVVNPDRVYTILSQDHVQFEPVQRQMASRNPRTVLVEPIHQGTGPGFLLALLHIHRSHPDSTVTVLPSDHFILQEDIFLSYLQQAFETVEASPAKMVFLAAEPHHSEPECGFLIPDSQGSLISTGGRQVLAFAEAAEPSMAAKLIASGGLWNTGILVFNSTTLLNILRVSTPKLYGAVRRFSGSINTRFQSMAVESFYREIQPLDLFSDLVRLWDLYWGSRFCIIPMPGVFWSNWSCASRIVSVLEEFRYLNRLGFAIETSGTKHLHSREESTAPMAVGL